MMSNQSEFSSSSDGASEPKPGAIGPVTQTDVAAFGIGTTTKAAPSLSELISSSCSIGKELTGWADCPFKPVSVRLSNTGCPELKFLRVVSYLYVLYNEAGAVHLDYLLSAFKGFNLDLERAKAHTKLVDCLRTMFQHNQSSESARDEQRRALCFEWFRSICGHDLPESDNDWADCLAQLNEQAVCLLQDLCTLLEGIVDDEGREIICTEWDKRMNRERPTHYFDALISEIAHNIGHQNCDPRKIRIAHYDEWKERLSELDQNADIDLCSRQLVEQAFLVPGRALLPIDGRMLMEKYNLPPSPQVKRLLEVALQLYKLDRCNAKILLERLYGWIEHSS